ncbi:galactose oxidase/kelch repeat superfamily protein [Striga asiatica]|uniref:Galactose oxidase/kelch repeat superfamily protein n=1 Tax=Striga asiatica TaxID=4170 RepID=A0A5A7RGS2_STRAF|nr:galactose oxidase/kelch repeat superfamily protein [Striga asiatica]
MMWLRTSFQKKEFAFASIQEKRGKITGNDLLVEFNNLDKKKDAKLKYKLGLLSVVEHVVLFTECETLVDEIWFHLIEDLEQIREEENVSQDEEEEGNISKVKDEDEDEDEEEEENDASQSDPPQPQVLDAEKIATIVRGCHERRDENMIISPSPMSDKEMVGLHDDVGLEMRAKDDVVLVEDYFSEEYVSSITSDKNEHGFDTSVVINPSSAIVVF